MCTAATPAQARQLLKEFMHEFKPEQVKRYLAREVIGGLPNAAAIDLSQFAGLVDADDAAAGADEGGEYRELLEALRSTPAATALRPYEVNIVGRWAEIDSARPVASAPRTSACRGRTDHTDGRRSAASSISKTPTAGAAWCCRRWCPDGATWSARASPATSASTPPTPAAGMPSSGSTTAPGGWPTQARPMACASNRRAARSMRSRRSHVGQRTAARSG